MLVIDALDPVLVDDCARFDARYYSAGSRTLISVLENRTEGHDTASALRDRTTSMRYSGRMLVRSWRIGERCDNHPMHRSGPVDPI